jgi:hypothetical protein
VLWDPSRGDAIECTTPSVAYVAASEIQGRLFLSEESRCQVFDVELAPERVAS